MSVLRRHIKLEHLSKWSLIRSKRRANVVDVDIPEETSQFAELNSLTEDVGRNESVISNVFCKAAEWRKTDQWREGEVKSRGPQTRNGAKRTPNWRKRCKRRNGERRDGPDLRSALEALRTARITRAGRGGSDALHSVLTNRQRDRDRNA